MARQTIKVDSVGEAYLTVLADRGVDYLFGNAGTDFASIIEAFSKAQAGKAKAPQPLTVPHENVAICMAYGYFLATGRPQAVMVHVSVGTANAICGLMNASREQIPILFTAGRSPITEEGMTGTRSLYIHWAQEMFDQGSIVREMVKWDYELRNGHQVETVVDRALNMAMSEPRGPIYLSLPREVLAEAPGEFTYDSPTRHQPALPPAPDPNAIDEAAAMLAGAENPMIITGSFGRDQSKVPVLAELAERFAIPVIAYKPRYVALPTDHPMHLGYEPGPYIKDPDVILVLDCDVPWIPSLHKVNPDTKVIHMAADPMFGDYTIRGFPCDLAITGHSSLAVPALAQAMAPHEKKAKARIDARRARVAEKRTAALDKWAAEAAAGKTASPITAGWLGHCVDQLKGADDIVVNESQVAVHQMRFTKPGTYFGPSGAGGLGWGMGAALGVKLGLPDRRVFSIVGDGSYMFCNPTPCHFVSQAHELPVLNIVLNNGMWGSVRKATLGIYPDGEASRSNQAPLTFLKPQPEYHKIVEASGGYGEAVQNPADLPGALERAMKAVEVEKRPALVNVFTAYDDAQALADATK